MTPSFIVALDLETPFGSRIAECLDCKLAAHGNRTCLGKIPIAVIKQTIENGHGRSTRNQVREKKASCEEPFAVEENSEAVIYQCTKSRVDYLLVPVDRALLFQTNNPPSSGVDILSYSLPIALAGTVVLLLLRSFSQIDSCLLRSVRRSR